jgi:hypothetical protein
MPTWRQGLAGRPMDPDRGTRRCLQLPWPCRPTLQLGATGPVSKVIAWTGFSIDARDSSVYSTANGGHNDYAGNEVNRIRLSDKRAGVD